MAGHIFVDDGGSNTSPYDTWAKAATTLQTGLNEWASGDYAAGNQIWVDHDHAESYSSAQTLTCTNASETNPAVIVSVNSSTDAYAPQDRASGTTQYQTTTTSGDLTISKSMIFHGLKVEVGDALATGGIVGEIAFIDCALELSTARAAPWNTSGISAIHRIVNCEIDFNSAGVIQYTAYGPEISFNGCKFYGTANSNGITDVADRGHISRFWGCDFSGMTFTGPFVNQSANNKGSSQITLAHCTYASGMTALTDDGFNNHGQVVEAHCCSTAHNLWESERHTFPGSVVASTTQTHTGGYTDIDGDTLVSHLMTPRNANACGRSTPLKGISLNQMYEISGSPPDSKTITLYLYHDFTTLTDADFYMEVYFVDTNNEIVWGIDVNPNGPVVAGTSITASSWQSITTTVSIEETGIIRVVPCLGKFESGKVVYVDPKFTVT